MVALIASFFSLCVGPLVYQTFGPLRRTDKIVNGIVLVVVGGTILFETVPETYHNIGFTALLLALIGFVGPTLIERSFQKAADTTHKVTILLGICGLLLHAMIDGMAIQSVENKQANGLALAIIIHRLPVGLTIWWLLKPLLGEKYALITLLFMGLFTFAGYAVNSNVANLEASYFVPALQAFIGGSLLHVVIHKPHADGCMHTSETHSHHHPVQHTHQKNKLSSMNIKSSLLRWENLGFLAGVIILVLMHQFES